ncbi:MAG: 16S rRNA (cytosine(1402)-N(4))-methyltransferase RsmH [Pseudomonadota bacterium]
MDQSAPHIPVLLGPLLSQVAPVSGVWIDGTMGAGGYTRALVEAGANQVIAIDRDPTALTLAQDWAPDWPQITVQNGRFGQMDALAAALDRPQVDGVVLDIGVSSMQIDEGARGFSFVKPGPLDMRMEQSGASAADLVNGVEEGALADILFHYGEERKSRRVARAIHQARIQARIETTQELAEIVSHALPRPKPGQIHPATRSFQALRIAVNDELGQLAQGLAAAERALAPGGWLAVVTFHSLEDRIVKRFLRARSDAAPSGNRYAPPKDRPRPRFSLITRKAVAPDEDEVVRNPRARSAKLRVARRLDTPSGEIDPKSLGLPPIELEKLL